MPRVAVTTIARGAPLEEPGGRLSVVDLDARAEVARAPLPDALHRARDLNPRGGLRGGRGLAAGPGTIALAIHDRILVLGSDWSVERVISHRWAGGIHDIVADESGVWAAIADNDLVVRIDWDGCLTDHWHWRSDRRVRRALGLGSYPPFSRWTDHRDPGHTGVRLDVGHVNAVARRGDDLLITLGVIRRPRAVWPMAGAAVALRAAARVGLGRPAVRAAEFAVASAAGRRLLARGSVAAGRPGFNAKLPPGETWPDWRWALLELPGAAGGLRGRPAARVVTQHRSGGLPVHNAVPFGDLVAVNDSARGQVLALDVRTGTTVASVQIPGELPFPRGLLRLNGNRFLVGVQHPGRLLVVDLGEQRIEDEIPLPDDRDESPYAIAFVPDGFDDPAGRLPATRAGWGIPGGDASASAQATSRSVFAVT